MKEIKENPDAKVFFKDAESELLTMQKSGDIDQTRMKEIIDKMLEITKNRPVDSDSEPATFTKSLDVN
jgi:hypothetical protein